MAMRDDGWYPGDDGRDVEGDAEEARVVDILRRALTSDATSAPQAAEPRRPAVTLATYRRMFERMTERDDFTRGALIVPARLAPQLLMQLAKRDETLRVTGQRTSRHPPSVRISCMRISLPPPIRP